MKDKWYGDNRDLVKWGVLLELTRRFDAEHILQVLYYRPNEWEQLEIDGEQVPLPPAVIQHFRNTSAITAIQRPPHVEVVGDRFDDRSEYLRIVLQRLKTHPAKPRLVFLDPDTGLESRHSRPEHVLNSELAEIWREMAPGDVLVFYQHQTNRSGTPWIKEKQAQFECALGLNPGSSKVALAPKIARDVAFFFIRKTEQNEVSK